ncbi:MAG: biosynthetic-type acetolactate synthase large subunit [Ruminococcus sp.]|nr:biosynthetic-type acetolactate synthase large subunit [Ruminococcus sp.]
MTEKHAPEKITAAAALVRVLEIESIDCVFGYPGAAICPIYRELSKSNIKHILVRREDAAGHAASGFARTVGKPAVCFATSGPGALNLIPALAAAYSDSIPLIAITGQVPTSEVGSDAFQEADITGAAEPFVKYGFLIKDAQELTRIIKESFYIAASGRPGPVLIDIPVDLGDELIDFSYPESVSLRSYKPTVIGNETQIEKAADIINAAENPLILAGGGVFCANAAKELRDLAHKANIPVAVTMQGLGVIAGELFLGMTGRFGEARANAALEQCDTLILVGARIGERTVAEPKILKKSRKIIHIDIDPAEIKKNITPNVPIVGDCKNILPRLTAAVLPRERCELPEDNVIVPDREGFANPKRVMEKLSQTFANAVVCADVGQSLIWTAKYYKNPERILTSGGMGTMGYALPAAVGAKLAAPEKTVVAICGDGALMMSLAELATIREQDLSIIIVVFNNGTLGMVSEYQKNTGDKPFAVSMPGNPNISRLAESFYILSSTIVQNSDIDTVIETAKLVGGTVIIEVLVSPDEPSNAPEVKLS